MKNIEKRTRGQERGVGTLGTFGLGDGKRENKIQETREIKKKYIYKKKKSNHTMKNHVH
jgi:hypothetical protein